MKKKIGIKKRFPFLPNYIIESSWSGIVSRSRNGSQIFEKINENIFVAGCYNGSGIGVGSLFGEQIALKASGNTSESIKKIESIKKPNLLPLQFFLNLGVKVKLIYERFSAMHDV